MMPKKDKTKKAPTARTNPQVRKPDPDRATAAVEVLQAVWLSEQNFNLEHRIGEPPLVREDSDGHLWVTVELHVPALDVDMWLDGTHGDHPDNQPDGEQDDAPG